MRGRAFLLAIAVSLLAGCTVGPNYHRPNVAPPPSFRDSVPATSAASLADARWFEVFKDQELQSLIHTALQRNYDVREAAARVEAEQAALGITRADQYPTVAVSADVTSQRISRGGSFPLPEGFKQDRGFGSVASNLLSYEVDAWGRLRRATEAARATLLASEDNQKVVAMILVSDLATAYFNLLELDEELHIAQRTLATRQESLRVIQTRQNRGLATILDVRQAEQLVQVATEAIPSIQEGIEQTENQIKLLTGEDPGPIDRSQLGQQQLLPAVPAGLPSALLDRRPDIREAEQNLVAANATIGVVKAAYFPQISLTGLFGFQSNQLSSLFSGPTEAWQLTPQLTQSVFAGGRIKSNVRLAEAQQQIALVQYERTIRTAFREVADALVQYRKLKEIRDTQQALVATLQDRSRLSYRRYQGGVDTLLSALDADRDLFDAELRLAQIRRDELVSIVQLYRALGGGWQQ